MAAAYKIQHVAVLNDFGLDFTDTTKWPRCKFYGQYDCPYIPYDVVVIGLITGCEDTFERAEEWLDKYRRVNPLARYILACRRGRANTTSQLSRLARWWQSGVEVVEAR